MSIDMGIAKLKRLMSTAQENLKLQLFTSVLICLVIAFGSFLVFHFSIRWYFLSRNTEDVAKTRLLELERDFQYVVSKDGIAAADRESIERWARRRRVSVFAGDQAMPEGYLHEGPVVSGVGPDGFVLRLSSVINYSDGESATCFVYTPLRSMRFISWAVGLLLAFDVFLASLFLMLKKKLNYILKIERGIGIMESGGLDHEIPVEGTDELARLASNINLLSRSIRDRIDSEQKTLQANRQIIGDLSHDIRTPLTVGMGYLTLLLEKNDLSEQERREYLTLALKKAEQLKERTRALLEFATMSSGQLPVHKAVVDVRTMTEQLKMELSALGEVRAEDDIPAGTTISGDVALLERLFDNLLSNLQKYGDTSEPLIFRTSLRDGYVGIAIENAIGKSASGGKAAEYKNGSSLSLGLKICGCILELHGGRFEFAADEDKNTFCVQIFIPVR